ncbi:toll/interleukin-1 receptor domain-containing protein [Xanthomonas sp. Kuri4-1]
MKVFISWSGDRSREVANLLREWLSCVIQAVKPWVSTRDIDRGSLWFGEISTQLQDATVGIICLTQQNKNAPWILFEAGALAKGLSTARVCTFLIDLEPADIKDPLAQFNHTQKGKESMYSLAITLNSSLGEEGLDDKTLTQVFETYWPQFEEKFEAVLRRTPDPEPEPKRKQDDVLAEILQVARSTANRVSRLELEEESRRQSIMVSNDMAHGVAGRYSNSLAARSIANKLAKAGTPLELIVRELRDAVPIDRAFKIAEEAIATFGPKVEIKK